MDKIWMQLATNIAARSTCARSQVGCVITDRDKGRVLSVGYNGNYVRGPNACDSGDPGNCGCIHAETNALLKLIENPKDKIVYCTESPCKMCTKLIINSGCSVLIFGKLYRLTDHLKFFTNVGIKLFVMTEEGELEAYKF